MLETLLGLGLIWIILLTIAYGLPTIIAIKRKHRNVLPIFLLNVIFGGTGIIWIICLIWSLTDNTRKSWVRNNK